MDVSAELKNVLPKEVRNEMAEQLEQSSTNEGDEPLVEQQLKSEPPKKKEEGELVAKIEKTQTKPLESGEESRILKVAPLQADPATSIYPSTKLVSNWIYWVSYDWGKII